MHVRVRNIDIRWTRGQFRVSATPRTYGTGKPKPPFVQFLRKEVALYASLVAVSIGLGYHTAYGQSILPLQNSQNSTAQAVAEAKNPDIPVLLVTDHYGDGIGTSDAASEGVVLGSLLQDRPFLRPGEVLETVPGLVVTQHSGDGKANQYFLRGYNHGSWNRPGYFVR